MNEAEKVLQCLGRIKRTKQVSVEELICDKLKKKLQQPDLPVMVIHDETQLTKDGTLRHFQQNQNAVVILGTSEPVVGTDLSHLIDIF